MNNIEKAITEKVLAKYSEMKMLTPKSVDKLRRLMQTGKMKPEDWISVFDSDRQETKEGQDEN